MLRSPKTVLLTIRVLPHLAAATGQYPYTGNQSIEPYSTLKENPVFEPLLPLRG